jgi:hypothetical protein
MLKDFLPWAGIAVSVIGFILLYTGWVRKVEARLVALETKIEPWWSAMLATSKELLKQPVHFVKDDLLERFPNLSHDEMCKLREMILAEKETYLKAKDFRAMAATVLLIQVDHFLKMEKKKC